MSLWRVERLKVIPERFDKAILVDSTVEECMLR